MSPKARLRSWASALLPTRSCSSRRSGPPLATSAPLLLLLLSSAEPCRDPCGVQHGVSCRLLPARRGAQATQSVPLALRARPAAPSTLTRENGRFVMRFSVHQILHIVIGCRPCARQVSCTTMAEDCMADGASANEHCLTSLRPGLRTCSPAASVSVLMQTDDSKKIGPRVGCRITQSMILDNDMAQWHAAHLGTGGRLVLCSSCTARHLSHRSLEL